MDKPNNIEHPIPLEQITPENHPELFEHLGVASERIDIKWVEKIGFWSIVWAQFKKNKVAVFGLFCVVFLVLLAIFAPVITLDKPFYARIDDLYLFSASADAITVLDSAKLSPKLQQQFQGFANDAYSLSSESEVGVVTPGQCWSVRDLRKQQSFTIVNQSNRLDVYKAEGWYFPWCVSLFDRNFFENGVDIFFNVLMAFFPVYLLLWWWLRRKLGKSISLYFAKIIGGFILVQLTLYTLIMLWGSYKLPARYYTQITKNIGVTPLFDLYLDDNDSQCISALTAGNIPDRLQSKFARKLRPLTSDAKAVAVDAGSRWQVREGGIDRFAITRIGNKLEIRRVNDGSFSFAYPLMRFAFRNTDISGLNPRPPGGKFLLGTDNEGHDVLTVMIYGTRISLTIGIVAVSIYITIGILLGATAGFFGGKLDLWISRFIEIMICFPTFFLILTLSAFVEKPSIFYIMIIIGVTRWTTVARLIRGEFLRLRGIDYVQASIALGFNKARIIFGHVLPNALGPVLVAATFGVASSILTESTLSFLGLGDPTAPSWGVILSQGRLEKVMWLILTPGLAIFFVVSVFNLVAEGLRDALDPKLRQ